MTAPTPPDSLRRASSDDDRLAELLARLTDALHAGRAADLEAVAAENPDLVGPLRELWAAVVIAEELGGDLHVAEGTLCETAADLEELGAGSEEANRGRRGAASGLAPMATTPPRRFGDYDLLEPLGRGGMGVVYRARQRSLGRVVALKLLSSGSLSSLADRARFRAEAESAARLDHPQILPVFEVGEADDQPFFSMKLVEGTTLAGRLADGPLPPRETATLLAAVSRAIHYAHEHGVLHRDLKPSNLLIDGDGRPFVADFGLAKRLEAPDSLTRSGAILGTPSYMAPEQAGGPGVLSPATDVYGLGSILYQMLCGRPPFQSASPLDTVLELLENDPPAPRVLNPRADRDLEMIALKCLQKPPELRYASAAQLADDLEAYLAGEPIAARSGRFSQVLSRLLRETHHATVLENWGLLWMWHSVVLLVLCVGTNALEWTGVASPLPYLAIWTVGLGAWAAVFWALRRRAGPVTFVERQIAHVWAASVIASVGLFIVEILMGLPVLTLSPVLPLFGASVFIVKAGILSGTFYFQAAACCLTAVAAALFPTIGLTLFGIVSAACFFVPGLKYYRQRGRAGP